MESKQKHLWSGSRENMAVAICLVFIVFAAGACSSTGPTVWPEITVPKTVRQPASLDGRVAPHYHLFVTILKSNGFEVGQTSDSRALEIQLGFDRNPNDLDVVASLWHEGNALFTVKGTYGAYEVPYELRSIRTAPTEVLARQAAQRFERQLKELRPSLTIVADSPLPEVTRQN